MSEYIAELIIKGVSVETDDYQPSSSDEEENQSETLSGREMQNNCKTAKQ